MKYARIIEQIAADLGISNVDAMDIFYNSRTFQLISQGIADFHCRLKTQGKANLEKRLFWETAVETDVPYIKYYKKATAEMARQIATWLLENQ